MLVLWGSRGTVARGYDAMAIWRQYCAGEVMGGAIESSHYIAEENPAALLEWFGKFF